MTNGLMTIVMLNIYLPLILGKVSKIKFEKMNVIENVIN